MNDKYLAQCGDTNECDILLRVGTKDRDKGLILAEIIVEDLLSSISFTLTNMKDNKKFKKSLKKIEKTLWKCLKEN